VRAGRIKPAGFGEKGRDDFLVNLNKENKETGEKKGKHTA
jgi:hypothetical protein